MTPPGLEPGASGLGRPGGVQTLDAGAEDTAKIRGPPYSPASTFSVPYGSLSQGRAKVDFETGRQLVLGHKAY